MEKEQLRHAKSIARHILVHVQRIERDMATIENISFNAVQDLPVNNFVTRFTHDLQHDIHEINQVITDMLPELERE